MTTNCEHCDNKQFVYCERMGDIRRCMYCNPPKVEFGIFFRPGPRTTAFEAQDDLAAALAHNFGEVADMLDDLEIENKF